ncbi:MAG: Fe-S cluster assembly transcriptional regulator IscR [Gammaproteobacteria bacterium]|nr:MAG: Fe-S cluster assembly transcriptional regulator IscR [Gammaproteobacteria bacterium]
MKMTTKGRYAVTAMLDLALHGGERPIPLADISRRQGISLSYLEQLFACLRRKGLVKSTRGPGGGYRLAAPVDQVWVGDIVKAVHEDLPAKGQLSVDQPHYRCFLDQIWMELSREIEAFLGSVSLAHVMGRQEVRTVAIRQQERFTERRTTQETEVS